MTKPILTLAAVAAIAQVLTTAPAVAAPSFSCSGNLNRTEVAICRSERLGTLDREMVGWFRRVSAQLDEGRVRALRQQQRDWIVARNACAAERLCIAAAYTNRIALLKRLAGASPERTQPPDDAAPEPVASGSSDVERVAVLPDGTLERYMKDGRIVRRFPNGKLETEWPDGRKSSYSFYTNTQPGNLPALPPGLEGWGTELEGRLLGVLENILSDAEYNAYRQTESGKDGYVLIDWRLSSLQFLTQDQ